MGFMRGSAVVRRTNTFLKQGIVLSKHVKAVAFQWNPDDKTQRHYGLGKFVFWHLPQLIHNNPDIHFTTLHKITPTPWIKVYTADDDEPVIDCDCRSREEIYQIFNKVFKKTMNEQEMEVDPQKDKNPAGFGIHYPRQCICEAPGQFPCPSFQTLPKHMGGTFHIRKGSDDS